MGQNSSRGSEQVDISINHPKFVQSKILTQSQKEILKTTLPCDQKAYKVWKELLQKHKCIDHEYLLLPKKHKFKPTGMCATRGIVEIEYGNHPYLLTDEIHNRRGKRNPFTEPELWYLLYAYLSAKNYLLQNEQYPYTLIGDVRPDNVFINQSGEVKFSNLLSWPAEKINYRKTFDGITTYLSPEDYELLQLGTMNNEKNQKSQFFSIGFTLVSAAILKDNTDVYNIEKQKFNENEARKRINSFKCLTVYSQLLRGIISSFCGFEPNRRIQFSDIWVWIAKYQHRITTKQPFMIEEIPPKINEHINLLRVQILAIEPGTSELNLSSIKSLRGSQAKYEVTSIKKIPDSQGEKSQIKYLKQVDKTTSELQTEKRKSRIVLNAGQQQKVFYSPDNAYFASRNGEGSQITQLRSGIINQQENSKIPTFYSPRPLQSSNFQHEGQKVAKSPDGFYSPKSGNQKFRVFIQYKSPSKPIERPSAETIYIGRDGQTQSRVIVQSMDNVEGLKKKDTDSKSQKSQKSGGSNRQNRFIEETKRESELKKQVKQECEIKQLKDENLKKESPIHKITCYEGINQCVSEVVSEQIIMPKIEDPNKNSRQSIQLQNGNSSDEHLHLQQKDNQTYAEIHRNGSNRHIVIEQTQSSNLIPEYQNGYQRSQPKLSQSEELRLITEEEINELTYDKGEHVVTANIEEMRDKKEQQSERQKILPATGVITQFQDLVDEIFPVSLETVKLQNSEEHLIQLQAGNHSPLEKINAQDQATLHNQHLQEVQHQSTDIIENQIALQKQPEYLNSLDRSHHSDHKVDNIGEVKANENILILDQQSEQEVAIQNMQTNTLQSNEHAPQEITSVHCQVIQYEQIQTKKPQSPFEQIQEQQEPSQFHSQYIAQVIEVHPNIISIDQESLKLSKNQPKQQLQQGNIHNVNQLQSSSLSQQPAHQPVLQQVIDLSLKDDNTQMHYETVKLNSQIPLEDNDKNNDNDNDEIVSYNVIEVNDISNPLDNGIENDSEIEGSGRSHSVTGNQDDIHLLEGISQTEGLFDEQFRKVKPVDNKIIVDEVSDEMIIASIKQLQSQPNFKDNLESVVNEFKIALPDLFINNPKLTNDLQTNLHNIYDNQNLENQPHQLIVPEGEAQGEVNPQLQQFPNNQGQEIQNPNTIVEFNLLADQVHEDLSNKEILPVQSNEKLPIDHTQEPQLQILEPQIHQLQSQPKQIQDQNIQTHPQMIQPPVQEDNIHLFNLQAAIPRALTESEFGNISEIMDINKVFNNTLNFKQRNFLEGTVDPRSEELFKELMNLSQKGQIQETDMQKIHMTSQDRDKLAGFMRRWQQFNQNQDENAQLYIEQFRQAITRSHIESVPTPQENEQIKLHMSAQDKQKLKLVVDKLNAKNKNLLDQLQQSPSDRKLPLNHDQSYVQIKCSELKTDIISVQKEERNDGQHQQANGEKDFQGGVEVVTQRTEEVSEEANNEAKVNYQPKSEQSIDLIDEVIQVNKSLSNQNEASRIQENQPQALQPATINEKLESNLPERFIYEVELDTIQINNIIVEVDNVEFGEEDRSRVNASAGEKSEREDPLNEQVDLHKVTENETVENLQILKNHRTYSEPNNFLERDTFSDDESPDAIKPNYTDDKNTITEDFQQNEEATEISPQDKAINQLQLQKIETHHNNASDLVEQINKINQVITNSVQYATEQVVVVQQTTVQTPNVIQTQKPKAQELVNPVPRSSARSRPKRDFLDDVMAVNKIINHEENKDYSKGNKYLHEQNQRK